MNAVAEALRKVTAAMQQELESGRRSTHLDANDLIDLLLAVADEIDPPFAPQPRDERPRTPSRD
jgi:hypothetical protein